SARPAWRRAPAPASALPVESHTRPAQPRPRQSIRAGSCPSLPLVFGVRTRAHLITARARQTRRFCERKPSLARALTWRSMIKFEPSSHGILRQRNPPDFTRGGDAALVPRLRDERDRGKGATRRPGRPETGP